LSLMTIRTLIFNACIPIVLLASHSGQCWAQTGHELEVSIIPSSTTARGGEHFTYKVIVKNRGDEKAVDVKIVIQDFRSGEFISITPTAGTCSIERPRGENVKLRCVFGDLAAQAEAHADVSVKFFDRDEVTVHPSARKLAEMLKAEVPDDPDELIATVLAGGRDVDRNRENDVAYLHLKLLPSRNLRPKVRIISPQPDSTFVKRLNEGLSLTIRIEAVDSDGKIEKVIVEDPFHAIRPVSIAENGEFEFLYMGKTYSASELELHARTSPPVENRAAKVATNIYEFVVTRTECGANRFRINAIDDGGRVGSATLDLMVTSEGDKDCPKQD
jgi:uncharacterized repeat protein (TIGR01451 family)